MPLDKAFVANEMGGVVLLGSRRRTSGQGIFPRIPSGSPVSDLYDDIDLTGAATLYSYTVIHPNPKTGQQPFVLAYVDYEQDARVFARLDCPPSAVRIGMMVEARPTDETNVGFVFVPAGEK